MGSSNNILGELEHISAQHDGVLRAEDVVEYAKDADTALHDRFTWDNIEAGDQYRLWQARQIIRVSVTMLPNHSKPVRAFVSMMDDRTGTGGGYRDIVSVFSNAKTREAFLAQALAELSGWEERYKTLEELAPILRAAARIRQRKAKAS